MSPTALPVRLDSGKIQPRTGGKSVDNVVSVPGRYLISIVVKGYARRSVLYRPGSFGISMNHLLAIDQGTTSTRAIVFSPDGEILDLAQADVQLLYPHKGWVEQSAERLWQDTLNVVRRVISPDVVAIGIANQRETTIVWDRATGKPIYNAIVWQDHRTAGACDHLKQQGVEAEITAKTGLLIDPYFSATKIV